MLMKLLITVFSITIIAFFVPGIYISGPWAALWVSLILGTVNVLIRPLLILVTLPINILSFGLFTLVINASMVLLVSSIVQGFVVDGFLYAFLFSVILSLLTSFLNKVIADKGI